MTLAVLYIALWLISNFLHGMQFAVGCLEADAHDESSTPVLIKHFLGKPLRLDVDMGETSPVSILESPFGDEVCTTSESCIIGANLASLL